jgi:hypothetical protein
MNLKSKMIYRHYWAQNFACDFFYRELASVGLKVSTVGTKDKKLNLTVQ